jgi:hypothetical protein
MSAVKKREIFSLLLPKEGGFSLSDAKFRLSEVGITDVQKEHSPYVGHYGLSVPRGQASKAEKVLL